MKYYILKPEEGLKTNGNDYCIIKVKEVDEANFIEDYGHRIIVSGASMMEALLNFEAKKDD